MGKELRMPLPVPDSERDRMEEAVGLLKKLIPDDQVKLTTWEVVLVDELREGKACTRIRLKELREAVHRIYPDTPI